MIKYLWIVILVIVHAILIGYVIYDAEVTYKWCMRNPERKFNLKDFIDHLDNTSYKILATLGTIWFIVSLIMFILDRVHIT